MSIKHFRFKKIPIVKLDKTERSLVKGWLKKSKKEVLYDKVHTFPLSEIDRITWVTKVDRKYTVKEITCVSYDLLLGEKWYTVVRFDNCHEGKLHRHLRVSVDDASDIADSIGIKKSYSSQKHQLTWTMKILNRYHSDFRNGFIKRSKKFIKENHIDLY